MDVKADVIRHLSLRIQLITSFPGSLGVCQSCVVPAEESEVSEFLLPLRLATSNQKISNPQFIVVFLVRMKGDMDNAFCI